MEVRAQSTLSRFLWHAFVAKAERRQALSSFLSHAGCSPDPTGLLPLVTFCILIPLLQGGLCCFFSYRAKLYRVDKGSYAHFPRRSYGKNDCFVTNPFGNSCEPEQNDKLNSSSGMTSTSLHSPISCPSYLVFTMPT